VDDPRVIQAVQDYLATIESGSRPNRQAFLAQHPDIADALAECLDALDFVHAVGPKLDPPALTSPPPVDPALPLGDFRILREVGRGGMGIVYEAEQLSLRRRVALKVLPFAWTLDPRQLRRFQNEARAVAHLHHTNIIPIYSVGCERGVHFYAMQFVEGKSLAAVIEELKHVGHAAGLTPAEPAGTTMAALTTERTGRSFHRAVAQLGLQAAEALEHAHEQGVVHRDIKPANLLVDGQGHLWVSDFGLAQFQGEGALTVTGDVLGTLRYMSPEQALGKRGLVDHRTDVYALGATLFELLTQVPVFTGRDREELLRQIAFDEPCPPRRLSATIPVDLETILLKALCKRVEDRYATAQELADDLRRFLEHRPILAKRPTPLERTTKWFRRHPAIVLAAVVLLVLAAVGFGISTALISREQWKTKAALEAEAEQRARAERTFRQARQVVDFFAELGADQLAKRPEMQALRRRILEVALQYYEDFIDQCRDDSSLQAELLASQLRVVTILDEIGSPEETLAALDRARQLHGRQGPGRLGNQEFRKAPSAGGRAGPHRGGQEIHLLAQQPSVQQELQLSPEQLTKISQLLDRRREAFRQLRDISPEEWRFVFEALATHEKRQLADLLQPTQAQRLHQIALQLRGAEAFSDPEVVGELRLEADQKERINALREEARRAVDTAMHSGLPRAEAWKKVEEAWRNAREAILASFTPVQLAKWQELTGPVFQGELRPPPRDGFGPGPGGPRGP
jgi:serine/threonine protein kinase